MEHQANLFGRYRLLEAIGAGGMAEVFLAKMEGIEGFERRLAIKRILPHYSKNENFVRMFIDEARLVGHFTHPNIVQIYDFGKINDCYYISMEYVEGIPVADILTRYKAEKKTLPIEFILEVGIQACRGIDYAHRETDENGKPLGIIHRDLTPHNLLVSKKGVVKITDFGIAKASMNTHLTQAGMIKGKVPYMSPEQAMGLPLTHVSDIFSIGIVMYEMCTLRRLFEGENDFTILRKVQEAKIPSVQEQNKSVPEELERIILKALTKDRNERYAWASEMEADLTRLKFSYGSLFQKFSLAEFINDFIATRNAQKIAAQGAEKPVDPPANAPGSPQPGPAGRVAESSGVPEIKVANRFGWAADDHATVMLKIGPDGAPSPVQPEIEPVDVSSIDPEGKSGESSGGVSESASQEKTGELKLPAKTRRWRPGRKAAVAVLAAAAAALIWFLVLRTGSLVVETNPRDADIFINGEHRSSVSPFTVPDLEAGTSVVVTVKKAGYHDFTQTLRIQSGVLSRLPVKLQEEPQFGYLILDSKPPGARVELKGHESSWTTPCRLNLAPGVPYQLTFSQPGFEPLEGTYSVTAGEERRVNVDFEFVGPPVPAEIAEVGAPDDGASGTDDARPELRRVDHQGKATGDAPTGILKADQSGARMTVSAQSNAG